MFKRKNPLYKDVKEFSRNTGAVATYAGIALKLILEIVVMIIGGLFSLTVGSSYFVMAIFGFIGLMIVQTLMFRSVSTNPDFTKYYALIYSFLLGMLYFGIIITFEVVYPGIILSALTALVSVVSATALLMITGLIKNSSRLRRMTILLSFSFIFIIMINYILSFFSMGIFSYTTSLMPYLTISLVSILIGVLYLIQDIDMCSQIVNGSYDKVYEWTCSSSLIMTLLWIFLDLLRILAIFRDN